MKRYFHDRFDIDFYLLILKYFRTIQKVDNIISQYNFDNVHVIIHVATEIIDNNVLVSKYVLILTSYQTQLKIYDHPLRNPFLILNNTKKNVNILRMFILS